ncbi:MAG TPA: helix-turn-helix domain-containing protein [Ktedonobacteraceae bacterium]
MSIDLLQEIGLNKYEAEAYYTLLTQGPLNGYELGKRSQVPLSRSYDVLERLSQKGLALVQPGEPVRYLALEPTLLLGQVRSTMEHTLNTLAQTLIPAQPAVSSGEFWVVRGRRHILDRAQTLCGQARRTISLALPEMLLPRLTESLTDARSRDCSVSLTFNSGGSLTIELLIDDHEALLGSLAPEETCQAVLSSNPALIASLAPARSLSTSAASAQPSVNSAPPDWLEWEIRKQQRLYKIHPDQRSA